MMERFSTVKNNPRSSPTAVMQNWVERYICGVNKNQSVVGNRKDEFGTIVTQLMYDNKNRWAHVCPFVRDSLDYDMFWIEESDVEDRHRIEELLNQQLVQFKSCPPAFDPVATGKAADLPVSLKTFLTFFPRIRLRSKGLFPMFDEIHKSLKPDFIRAGLMLGQFYAGCPVASVYNPLWKGPLISPYPAFATRYMAKHDSLFISRGTREFEEYKKYFTQTTH
jgi:hypothetical protein